MANIVVLPIVAYEAELAMIRRIIDSADDMRCLAGFTDADAALAALNEMLPDIVYINAQAPFDGLALAYHIHTSCPELPLVIYSTKPQHEDAAFDAGASAFLTTPIMPRRLLEAIRYVLENR